MHSLFGQGESSTLPDQFAYPNLIAPRLSYGSGDQKSEAKLTQTIRQPVKPDIILDDRKTAPACGQTQAYLSLPDDLEMGTGHLSSNTPMAG
jgi:hypothetical protein